jgi:hypothetical protein
MMLAKTFSQIDEHRKEREQLNQSVSSGKQLISALQQDLFLKAAHLSSSQSLCEEQSRTITRLEEETRKQAECIQVFLNLKLSFLTYRF